MEKTINILRWICVIALTIGIAAFGIIQIISSTILNKSFILSKLDETDYYINTYSQVNADFENYIYQSGLDKSVIEGLVTVEDVTNDTKYIISNIYDGRNEEIDVSKIEEKLRANIENIIESKNLAYSSQRAIDKFIETLTNQYKDSILHTDIENDIFDGLFKIKKSISRITTISVSIIGISAIFILASRYKKFWQNITIMGVPLVSTGVVYLFIDIYIKSNIAIKNITILSEAISYSIRTIIFSTLDSIKIIGIIMFIAGSALIISGNMIRTQKHKYSKRA